MLHGGQRRGLVVELGTCRGDVDTTSRPAHDRRAELLVGRHPPAERPGERASERDPVALHGDVEVELLLTQQDVPHRAADEVDAVEAAADGLDGLEDGLEAG